MDTIKWNNDWLLNHEVVDLQHKMLVSILNRIISREASMVQVVGEFIEYTAVHFADEEELMVRAGFADLISHREEHQTFTKTLLEMSFNVMTIDGEDPAELEKVLNILEKFAAVWFDHHFLEVDRKFIDYLNTQGGGK